MSKEDEFIKRIEGYNGFMFGSPGVGRKLIAISDKEAIDPVTGEVVTIDTWGTKQEAPSAHN